MKTWATLNNEVPDLVLDMYRLEGALNACIWPSLYFIFTNFFCLDLLQVFDE